MELFSAVLGGAALSGTIPFAGAGRTDAPGGQVVAFTTEREKPVGSPNPPAGGCLRPPPTAHTPIDLPRSKVFVYATPSCVGPGIPVEPERGRHIPPSGRFGFSVT